MLDFYFFLSFAILQLVTSIGIYLFQIRMWSEKWNFFYRNTRRQLCQDTMNSPSLSFSSLSRSRFRVTLPWFISFTPAAELDRIIIGSRNLLMTLRRSRRAASSHVRSLNADAIDPKSQFNPMQLFSTRSFRLHYNLSWTFSA